MNRNVELSYLEDGHVVSESDYFSFLKKQYGFRAHQKHSIRRTWYKKKDGYKILLAIENGKILGQSCAFKDIAIVLQKEIEIWWGIDAFVLPEARGRGLGKLLQKKLHEDLLNFSSAWYSPLNGIVKRKCGAKEIFLLSFCYYPVSSYISYVGTMLIKKITKRDISIRLPFSFIYAFINRRRIAKEYICHEVELNKDVFSFINLSSLKFSDFYIKRNEAYLKWRYIENPNLRYHVLEISRNKQIEAYVIFTHMYYDGKFRVSKIMDVFKKQSSLLNEKDILYFVSRFFKTKGKNIDGLLHLTECNYFPRFVRHTMFLSTINLEKEIKNPCISYSDQDMVQMYY